MLRVQKRRCLPLQGEAQAEEEDPHSKSYFIYSVLSAGFQMTKKPTFCV